MGTTLYVIFTLILFSMNLFVNVAAMSAQKNGFPTASFIATILSMAFIVWGITVLINS